MFRLMDKPRLLAASLLCMLAVASQRSVRGDEPIKHSLLIAGPTFTGILDEDGEVAWDAGRRFGRDAWKLDDNRLLLCWSNAVKEIDLNSGETTFEYRKGEPGEDYFGSVQRLQGGNTLIRVHSREPRLIEVTSKGEIARRVLLKFVSATTPQTAFARKLGDNVYVAPFIGGKTLHVLEYDAEGEVTRELDTEMSTRGASYLAQKSTTNAVRLPNGHTLVSSEVQDTVAELSADGMTVWSLTNDDLPEPIMNSVTGIQRLPNGNTVIANYKARGDDVKLFEVTREKDVVWKYAGPYRVFRFQVLTTNGAPIEGEPLR